MTQLNLNSYKTIKDNIIHQGIISKISENVVTVSLKGNVNCEGCKAQSACGVSDSNDKEIEIFNSNQTYKSYKLHETVDVVLRKELGLKAVFWAYVFPFILLFVVLIFTSLFLKEWIAGLLSIAILIPYYFVLYLMKDTFQKAFQVSILKFN
jgi:positive regulator of sigma E activity